MEHPNYKTAVRLVIQNAQNGNVHHEHVLEIGPTPETFLRLGFPPLPLAIKAKTIDKVYFDHGITRGILERLYNLVASPRAIYRSAPPHQTGHVAVTAVFKGNEPIIIALHPNKAVGRGRFVNEVASVYAKHPDIEAKWAAAGLKLWSANTVDEEKPRQGSTTFPL